MDLPALLKVRPLLAHRFLYLQHLCARRSRLRGGAGCHLLL